MTRSRPLEPGAPYRDEREGARVMLERLRAQNDETLAAVWPAAAQVYGLRAGRAAAGRVRVVMGATMFGLAVAMMLAGNSVGTGTGGALSAVLLTAWAASWLADHLARRVAVGELGRQLARARGDGAGLFQALERERAFDPAAWLETEMVRSERVAAAWSIAGLIFIAPLTIHLMVGFVLSGFSLSLVGYDTWIVLSAVLVGHCHALGAILAARHVMRLPPDRPVDWGAGNVLGWIIAMSCVPGIFAVGVPVVLVAVTGLFVVYGGLVNIEQRSSTERLFFAHVAATAPPRA